MDRRLGVDGRPDASSAACIGTKELVAGAAAVAAPAHAGRATPSSTRRSATRPTPWAPSWPAAGRCRCPSTSGGASTSSPIDAGRRRAGAVPVGQHAGQPGRRARRPRRPRRPGVGRHGVPGASATSATSSSRGTGRRRTILEHGTRRRASPSTPCRSGRTWPASGSGFYAGDAELVDYLREVRKHAGFMVAGPGAGRRRVAAGPTTPTSTPSGHRYRGRLERMAEILGRWGLDAPLPGGGFYLWVPAPGRRRLGARRAPGRPTAASWPAPASSTDRPAPATSAWPWCSPTPRSSWWPPASASPEPRAGRPARVVGSAGGPGSQWIGDDGVGSLVGRDLCRRGRTRRRGPSNRRPPVSGSACSSWWRA